MNMPIRQRKKEELLLGQFFLVTVCTNSHAHIRLIKTNNNGIIVGEALHLKIPVYDRKLAKLVFSPTAGTKSPQDKDKIDFVIRAEQS